MVLSCLSSSNFICGILWDLNKVSRPRGGLSLLPPVTWSTTTQTRLYILCRPRSGMNAEYNLHEVSLVVTNFGEIFLTPSPEACWRKAHFITVFLCVVGYFSLMEGLGLGVPAMRGVLVCQGCSNKVPQTGWLITKRIVFFHRNSRQKSAFHLPHAFCFLFWASVGLFLLHQLSNAPQKRDPSHSIISIRDTVAGFIHSCL